MSTSPSIFEISYKNERALLFSLPETEIAGNILLAWSVSTVEAKGKATEV